jgi:multiple antibiotic resistance protein
MTDFLNAFLLVYAGLFPILNPIGSAPIFLGLTSACTEGERNALARRVAVNSVLLLAGSMFIGTHLLVFFGITLPVVRIAAGMVLIAFGWKLLHNGAEGGTRDRRRQVASRRKSIRSTP